MIEIRELRESDWPRVSEIYIEALKVGKSTFQSECPTFAEWDKSHLQNCRFVLIFDGVIAGWCALSATSARAAYSGVVEVSIYFDENFQHRGLGTKLLQYLCEKSEKCGYWCLYACIFEVNKASLALHEKCGFRKIGYRERIAKDIFGNWQNTVLYERRNSIK